MFPAFVRFWQQHDGALARYLLAVLSPIAATFLAAQLSMPAFIFEHLMVLLVVALAILGGRGPAVVVAVVASIGDNILLREPIGRPAIGWNPRPSRLRALSVRRRNCRLVGKYAARRQGASADRRTP